MSKSIKAVLLSALVFPGLGHFFLKKPTTAAVLAGCAFVSLYWLVSAVEERTQRIIEQIQSGEVQLDTAAIAELVSKQAAAAETPMAVIVMLWLVAIIDAYRLGRLQDKKTKT